MWTGNTDVITNQTPRNYMFGEKVFILDEITSENCAFLIGDLSTFVFAEENRGKSLSFFINSPGGETYTMMSIIGLINIAKLYDIEVTTFVLGTAASAASMIAIQGDRRFMTNVSRHLVHFGSIWDVTTKNSEIEKIYEQNKEYADNLDNLYLTACGGKLTKAMLDKLKRDERGYLNAEDCVKYGFCDSIIENELYQKRFYDDQKLIFEKNFTKALISSQKKEKSTKKQQKPKKSTKASTKKGKKNAE